MYADRSSVGAMDGDAILAQDCIVKNTHVDRLIFSETENKNVSIQDCTMNIVRASSGIKNKLKFSAYLKEATPQKRILDYRKPLTYFQNFEPQTKIL